MAGGPCNNGFIPIFIQTYYFYCKKVYWRLCSKTYVQAFKNSLLNIA